MQCHIQIHKYSLLSDSCSANLEPQTFGWKYPHTIYFWTVGYIVGILLRFCDVFMVFLGKNWHTFKCIYLLTGKLC